MTLGQIKEATCAPTACAEKFMPYINETCVRYNINTPIRQLCFLSQVGHESGGLFYTEELASGQAYEGRKTLGNTAPGDGVRFKGRGLIQITGRANYKSLSDALGADFIKNPTLLGGKNVKLCTPDQLKYAAMSAGWFWNSRKLNDIADKINIDKHIDESPNLEFYKEITRKINGGFNGLPDRLNRYKMGVKYFVGMPVVPAPAV
jgi:putative chitinase